MQIYAVAPFLGQYEYALDVNECFAYFFDELSELKGVDNDLYNDYYKSLAVRLAVISGGSIFTHAVMPLSLLLVFYLQGMGLSVKVIIPSGNDDGYVKQLVSKYDLNYYKNYFCPLMNAVIDNSEKLDIIQLPVGGSFTDILG